MFLVKVMPQVLLLELIMVQLIIFPWARGGIMSLPPWTHHFFDLRTQSPSVVQTHDHQRERDQGWMEDARRSEIPGRCRELLWPHDAVMLCSCSSAPRSLVQASSYCCSILLWISWGFTPSDHKNLKTASLRCERLSAQPFPIPCTRYYARHTIYWATPFIRTYPPWAGVWLVHFMKHPQFVVCSVNLWYLFCNIKPLVF